MKFVLLAFVAFATTAQAQTLYFGALTKESKKNEFCYFKVSVPQIVAAEAVAPEFKRGIIAFNAKSAEILAQIESEYTASLTDREACTSYRYASQTDLSFHFSNDFSSTVISIYSLKSGYTGGAHGYAAINTDTFNTLTGENYANLGAFFDQSKMQALKELIMKKVKIANPYFDPTFGWDRWSQSHTTIDQIDNFYVSNKGIVVYFQQYEIGSYAEGLIEATLPWEELKRIGFSSTPGAKALLNNLQ